MGSSYLYVRNQAIGEAQVKPQLKPLVEQEKKPQVHDKSSHEDGGDSCLKKKTRRDGRARHPMLIQDAKMMSKNQKEKRDLAHIKCHACEELGHLASGCPSKLEKKAQANKEK